jgi:hypothetical protein
MIGREVRFDQGLVRYERRALIAMTPPVRPPPWTHTMTARPSCLSRFSRVAGA